MEKPAIEKGQIWMTELGWIVQITVLHGGYTDLPFQCRIAGSDHNLAACYEQLKYKIGG